MSDGVLLGIFASFVLIGVVSISYYILLKILHPRSNGRYIVVIPARAGMTDVAGKGYAQRIRSGMLGDGDTSFPLNTFEPAFAELSDAMADLEANMMHFQLMHPRLFCISFRSFRMTVR